jgi:dTDP-4-dehydrorhamnose reductase
MKDRVVWITGAGGLIGSYLVQTACDSAPGWHVVGLTRPQLELTDFAMVRRKFLTDDPSHVVHCAALSRSPACQANPALAHKLNVEITAFLAELGADIPFYFISSDLVFDGLTGNYDESAPVNPLSVYAQTKVAAEQIVLANPRHTVIRTSLNGGISSTHDRGFNEQLRNAWQEGKTLTLFTDEFRCPIPSIVTARALWELITRKQTPGLYHLAGAERLSRWHLGRLMAARWPQLNPKLVPGSASDYPGAPRSPDTSLNCAKIQRALSFALPGLTEWLAENPDEPF